LPRTARKQSDSGIYHVMARGINRQDIFKDQNDIKRYLETLHEFKDADLFTLYGYCFMKNHVHLLLREGLEPLGEVMRKIGSSYVYWYNRKYERVGYLFQDRFKSEPVEDDSYFLTVLRYIHHNPLKAGISKNISDYEWSSYHDYLNSEGIADIDFALDIFNPERKQAIKQFVDFHNEDNDDRCLDVESAPRLSDKAATEVIIKVCNINNPLDLQETEKSTRNECLNQLKNKYNLSIRQIERLTGINRNVIARA